MDSCVRVQPREPRRTARLDTLSPGACRQPRALGEGEHGDRGEDRDDEAEEVGVAVWAERGYPPTMRR
jgi:hypothetical protein